MPPRRGRNLDALSPEELKNWMDRAKSSSSKMEEASRPSNSGPAFEVQKPDVTEVTGAPYHPPEMPKHRPRNLNAITPEELDAMAPEELHKILSKQPPGLTRYIRAGKAAHRRVAPTANLQSHSPEELNYGHRGWRV
jgi:hypothetical protein